MGFWKLYPLPLAGFLRFAQRPAGVFIPSNAVTICGPGTVTTMRSLITRSQGYGGPKSQPLARITALKIRLRTMKLVRGFLTVALFFLLVTAAWLAWNRPQTADMARYAPADSLVYLESNSLLEIAESIVNTDAWKILSPLLGSKIDQRPSSWLGHFLAWTGFGPTSKVILSRAQVAVVMLDLGASEQGETLTIRPEAAILVETHTSERRIRSTVEEALERFAEKSYSKPTFQRNIVDQAEFLVWTAPEGDRQIVATIDGTLLIVGNSERAARTCLEVHRGQRTGLSQNQELRQMRANLASDGALAFGFVSSSHAAQLLSIGAPLLFGKALGDLAFERTIASGAAKVLGPIGWSSHSHHGGIEDRYLFSLQPPIVSRLRPVFRGTYAGSSGLKLLPDDVHSLTIYKFEDPAATWRMFESAVSAQLDTLSAVVFTSLAKSALLPYGIEHPEKFLHAVGPELITARLKPDAERALLIAHIRNEPVLREILIKQGQGRSDSFGRTEIVVFPEKRAISFFDGYLLMGSEEDVRRCVQSEQRKSPIPSEARFKKLEHFAPFSSSSALVTYTDESKHLKNFVTAVNRAENSLNNWNGATAVERAVLDLPYSATETTLDGQGIQRRTRSSLGQFSTLIPLLLPEPKIYPAKAKKDGGHDTVAFRILP